VARERAIDRRGEHIDRKLAAGAAFALALMVLQFVAIHTAPAGIAVRVMLPLTAALVPVALWPFRRWLGAWVILVGLSANFAAIVANGGLMPIERSTVARAAGADVAAGHASGQWLRGSKDVLVPDGGGRAAALGDSIIIPAGGRGLVASPGDVVIWCGLMLLGGEAAVRVQRRRPQEVPAPEAATPAAVTPARAQGGAATPR